MNRSHGISLTTATAIVIANMIGTGIFTSLGFQVTTITSGFALLMLWIVGGVFALCGALSYAELAAALPRSGGEFHFLSRIFHPALGFLAGWTSATVGFAAPIALAAMAFGKYFATIFENAPPLIVASLLVVAVTGLHLRRLELSSIFQNAFTLLKVGAVVAFIIAGLCVRESQPIDFSPSREAWAAVFSAPFAVSLIYVMYAYSGWNAATYLTGEVAHPERNLPRALLLGTVSVLVLYVALNWVFLRTTPIDKLAGQLEVAHTAAEYTFGPTGGRLMSTAICVGLIASVSAMTWAGPRVTQVMGQDLTLLRFLAVTNARGIPWAALIAQLAIVLVLLWLGTFDKVLVYVQFTLILCSFLTVCGLFYLRWREPELPRPYKTWGYPVTTIVFLAISLWMMVFIARDRPAESLAGLSTMFSGMVIYLLSPRRSPAPDGQRSIAP